MAVFEQAVQSKNAASCRLTAGPPVYIVKVKVCLQSRRLRKENPTSRTRLQVQDCFFEWSLSPWLKSDKKLRTHDASTQTRVENSRRLFLVTTFSVFKDAFERFVLWNSTTIAVETLVRSIMIFRLLEERKTNWKCTTLTHSINQSIDREKLLWFQNEMWLLAVWDLYYA